MKVQSCAVFLLVLCASYAFGAPTEHDKNANELGDPREAHLEEGSQLGELANGFRELADHIESAYHRVSKRSALKPTTADVVEELMKTAPYQQVASPTARSARFFWKGAWNLFKAGTKAIGKAIGLIPSSNDAPAPPPQAVESSQPNEAQQNDERNQSNQPQPPDAQGRGQSFPQHNYAPQFPYVHQQFHQPPQPHPPPSYGLPPPPPHSYGLPQYYPSGPYQ